MRGGFVLIRRIRWSRRVGKAAVHTPDFGLFKFLSKGCTSQGGL